jgi:uncharacterized protein (TIGR03435 family)
MNEIFNHLWQTTVFAVVIALAVTALRRNSPRLRYWLWLTASLKFLIPFSLIVSTGARIQLPPKPLSPPQAATVAQISTYLVEPASLLTTAVPVRAAFPWVPALSAIWLIGSLFLLFRWFRHWLTIHRAVRRSIRLPFPSSVPIFSTPAMMEPGVFGLFRPVLLLPEGIADRLTPEQFEAILGHELRHIRCMDNLTAAVHMGVETLFWFHPIVWWIGAKMMDERERDCDEAVLRQGSQPGDYARGIVHVCETYIKAELFCASGISGSELKKRIREVMTWRASVPVTSLGKVILASVAVASVLVPFAIGVVRAQTAALSASSPAFEVATIKPNALGFIDIGGGARLLSGQTRCHGSDFRPQAGDPLPVPPLGRCISRNSTLKELMNVAYGFRFAPVRATLNEMVIGGPSWVGSSPFDIEGKAEDPAATGPQMLNMLQTLLVDRFKIKFHRETRDVPGLVLVVGKDGSKLVEANAEEQPSFSMAPVKGQKVPIGTITNFLSLRLGRIVVDKTGLRGLYNFTLDWKPDELELAPNGVAAGAPPANQAGPSLTTALQEQLGLRLETQKIPMELIVLDSAEMPGLN